MTMNRPLRETVNHCCLEKGRPVFALPRQQTPWRECQSRTGSYPESSLATGGHAGYSQSNTDDFPYVLQSHCRSGSPRATCISTMEGRRPEVGAPGAETASHAPVCPQCLGHRGDPEERHRPRPQSRRDQDDTWADWGEGSCA